MQLQMVVRRARHAGLHVVVIERALRSSIDLLAAPEQRLADIYARLVLYRSGVSHREVQLVDRARAVREQRVRLHVLVRLARVRLVELQAVPQQRVTLADRYLLRRHHDRIRTTYLHLQTVECRARSTGLGVVVVERALLRSGDLQTTPQQRLAQQHLRRVRNSVGNGLAHLNLVIHTVHVGVLQRRNRVHIHPGIHYLTAAPQQRVTFAEHDVRLDNPRRVDRAEMQRVVRTALIVVVRPLLAQLHAAPQKHIAAIYGLLLFHRLHTGTCQQR